MARGRALLQNNLKVVRLALFLQRQVSLSNKDIKEGLVNDTLVEVSDCLAVAQ